MVVGKSVGLLLISLDQLPERALIPGLPTADQIGGGYGHSVTHGRPPYSALARRRWAAKRRPGAVSLTRYDAARQRLGRSLMWGVLPPYGPAAPQGDVDSRFRGDDGAGVCLGQLGTGGGGPVEEDAEVAVLLIG